MHPSYMLTNKYLGRIPTQLKRDMITIYCLFIGSYEAYEQHLPVPSAETAFYLTTGVCIIS